MYFSLFFLQKIYRVGLLLVLILVALDLLAFFVFPGTFFNTIFLATREQTPLTWLSALAMLFLGLASLSVYYQHGGKIWYFLAAVFLFFSLDDAVYLHERFSGYLQDHTTFLHFFPSYIWVLIYMPLLIFSLGTLIYFLWRKLITQSRKSVVLALILLGGAIALDLLDGLMHKDPSLVFCLESTCHLMALHILRLSEETLEVLALGLLGYILLREHCLQPVAGDSLAPEKSVV